jgi:hypothetical protein
VACRDPAPGWETLVLRSHNSLRLGPALRLGRRRPQRGQLPRIAPLPRLDLQPCQEVSIVQPQAIGQRQAIDRAQDLPLCRATIPVRLPAESTGQPIAQPPEVLTDQRPGRPRNRELAAQFVRRFPLAVTIFPTPGQPVPVPVARFAQPFPIARRPCPVT